MEKNVASANLEIPKFLVCPITGQLFFDPVVASDGQTYEREALQAIFADAKKKNIPSKSPMTNLPFASENMTEVAAIRGQSREFVERLSEEQRQKLYEEDEIFLPQSKIRGFIAAIQSGNVNQLKPFLDKGADPRLKTMRLDNDGNNCVGMACRLQTNPAVLSLIIAKLNESERKQLLIANEDTFQYLHDIAKYMQVPGLLAWQEALAINKVNFFAHCAFYAVTRNDCILLQNALMQISVDFEKESSNLLHTLVIAVSQAKDTMEKLLTYERLPMIRLLIQSNINTKHKNRDGLTPQELAANLNLPYLAAEIRREAWEHKNRATLEPMKEKLNDLTEKNEKLEKQLAKQSEQAQQLAQQQQTSHHQLVALSRAFRDLVYKREVLEFNPVIVRNFTMGKKIGSHLSIVSNRFLIARYSEQYSDDGIVIWDITRTTTNPIATLPSAKHDQYSSSESHIQYAGNSRILYLKPVKESRQNQKITLVLFDLNVCKEIKSYDLAFDQIAFMQMTSENQLFIINHHSECFMMDLNSGKLNAFPHFKVSDGSRGSGQILYAGWELNPRFLYIRPDRYNTEGLRIYNLAKMQDKQVTVDMPYGISQYDSAIFKVLSPDIFAHCKGDSNKGVLKLLDVSTGKCIETYSAPTVGTGWNANTPSISDICLIGTDKVATIHWNQSQKAKHTGAQLIVWDRASKKVIRSLIIPGKSAESLSIVYDSSADLLYASVESNIFAVKYNPPEMKPEIAALTDDNEQSSGKNLDLKH